MAYSKTTWIDRIVQFANRYTKSGETSTEVTLVQSPGAVTQAGTAVNAANLNKIEKGIEDAHATADAALPKAGGVMSGALQWLYGSVSAWGGGAKLVWGVNCYIDSSGVFRYQQVHPNAGARGIWVQYNQPNKLFFFDTGAVATEQGQTFVPTDYQIWHSGMLRDNAGVLEIFTSGAWKPVGGIKSVQRGVATISGVNDVTLNVAISSINLSKTFITITSSAGFTGSSNSGGRPGTRGRLTSATNLELFASGLGVGAAASIVNVAWEVIESY